MGQQISEPPAAANKGNLSDWRPADMIFQDLQQLESSDDTIFSDTMSLLSVPDNYMLEGKLADNASLWVFFICRNQPGVIQIITQLALEHGIQIIFCHSDEFMARVPDRPSIDDLEHCQKSASQVAIIKTLASNPLNQTSFQLVGNIQNLKAFWNDLASKKSLPDYYKQRNQEFSIWNLSGRGRDAHGLLNKLTKILFDNGINVRSLSSRAHLRIVGDDSACMSMTLEIPSSQSGPNEELLKAIRELEGFKCWNFKLTEDPYSKLLRN